MTNHEGLQQLTLWTKEALDAVEGSPTGCPDPVSEPDLHRQFVQQKGQSVYIQNGRREYRVYDTPTFIV